MSYIEAHPPAGGTWCTCGAGSDRKRLVIQYKWPNVSGVLTHRRLTVVLAKAARGLTGVLVDVQEVWIVPRAASYVIPATAKVLELTVAWPELGPDRPKTLLSTTVTEAAKVSAIVDAINKMALVQPGPGSYGCPPGRKAIATFTFLESTGGPTVAIAGTSASSKTEGICSELMLTLPALGKTVELEHGSIVELAENLLGEPVYTPEERQRP